MSKNAMAMEYNVRKKLRLQGYDYTTVGMYFITIVTAGRWELFGCVKDGDVLLSDVGKMIINTLDDVPRKEQGVEVMNSVVMPNHVHLVLMNTGEASISSVVRRFKGATTFRYKKMTVHSRPQAMEERSLWQRSYYDTIIRNERMLNYVNNYIATNPLRWDKDAMNCQCADERDEILKELHSLR